MNSKDLLRFDAPVTKITNKKIFAVAKDSESEELEVQFFLTLGLIFNDLKDLIILDGLIVQTYEQPLQNEISAHAGEYSGIRHHIFRLLVGNIHEFFLFLKEHRNYIGEPKFRKFLQEIPSAEHKIHWGQLEKVATSKPIGNISFGKTLKALATLRNNLAYHYKQSGPLLLTGINLFQSQTDKESFYVALGQMMVETRFYYVDAAAEQLVTNELEKMGGREEVLKIINQMNVAIKAVLETYLKTRGLLDKR